MTIKKTIVVTVNEAIMISMLRKYDFGTFTIHKVKGEPLLVETTGSDKIDPNSVEQITNVEFVK